MTPKQMKLLRLYEGLTQKEFAEKVDLALSTVAKVEAGFVDVSDVTRSRVLRVYDLQDAGYLAFCERMGAR
ncbi:helix-turn-helix domain-containing protein [Gracilibacillus caseinilyticus]|uniref:Helix-turn-helix domain-containing protein n=1 Tax=Gracilibacillus caseinilyticus TaxID=2932256 RepID=A0ABY4EVP6_9BACI|nr:helix-turn-helix transcriptional regulator [Gracilibacillus caseinilyticus]UOQ48136.1 helix-turn-helix domain-containing protein [Gracilibacillus caseinilyticus]